MVLVLICGRHGEQCADYAANLNYCLSASFYSVEDGSIPPVKETAKTMCCACGGAPAGYACDGIATILCPAGYRCVGKNTQLECDQGTWCGEGSGTAETCVAPAGRFCPKRTMTAAGSLCPLGFYCLGGTTSPLPCRVSPGSYCAPGSASPAPGVKCPVGHWCPGYCPPQPSFDLSNHSNVTSTTGNMRQSRPRVLRCKPVTMRSDDALLSKQIISDPSACIQPFSRLHPPLRHRARRVRLHPLPPLR